MEPRTLLNRVHKLAGFVFGDCRLRRDKRGDSYLQIDVLRLRLPATPLRSLGGAPLPVRAGARPADPVTEFPKVFAAWTVEEQAETP